MVGILRGWKGRLRNPRQKCLATVGVAVGSAAISTLFQSPEVGAIVGTSAFATLTGLGDQVWGVFKDVVNDIAAGSVDELMTLAPTDEKFKNHHLTRLVGEALRKIILEEATRRDTSFRPQEVANLLAERVKTEWAEFDDENTEPLSEEELTEIFALKPVASAQIPTLTPDFWARSLTALMKTVGDGKYVADDAAWTTKHGLPSTVDQMGKAISERLYPTMVNLLVNDAEQGGAAFAVTVFKLLSELCKLHHRIAQDVNKSKKLIYALGNAAASIEAQIQILGKTEKQHAAAILLHARKVHHNILALVADVAGVENQVEQIGQSVNQINSQLIELESTLQELLRPKLPTTKVPTFSRWIEMRHDKATLMRRP